MRYSPINIIRMRVMPLDQVSVIAVHGARTRSPTERTTTGFSMPAKALYLETRSSTRSVSSQVFSGGSNGSINPIVSVINSPFKKGH